MPVRIRFYAPYHVIAGTSAGEIEAREPFPAGELPARLVARYPVLGSLMRDPQFVQHIKIVRDGRVLEPGDPVADGETLQVLAPLLGG